VLQDTYIDAVNQFADYLKDRKYPFFLWLRFLTGNRLNKIHRYHLGTQNRDANRDVSLFQSHQPGVSSAALAAYLVGRDLRPDQIVRKAELRLRVHDAVNAMNEIDREVLSLRHFEHLSTAESAAMLGISEAAAGRRYLRALARIRTVLMDDAS
jgi:RNA polymerase sigma-70 factor, ECF subfamily